MRNYTTSGGRRGPAQVAFSGSSQGQQRDLWRDADAHRKAESPEAAVHIERSFVSAVSRGRGFGMTIHRQIVESRDERRDQSSRTDAVIHDLELDLPAMGVAGEAEFDAEFSSAPERIRIVRQQDVRHVAADQVLDFQQHWSGALAAAHVIALVIHAQQIETGAVVFDHVALRSQQAHAFFLEETLSFVFNSRINFVVAIASPDAERGAQAAQLSDAGFQGIAFAADEVSRDERDVWME